MRKKDKVQGSSKAERAAERGVLQKIERASRSVPGKLGGVRLGLGDDAALWAPRKGHETVLTTDWFLEGRHFLKEVHPADSVGWKCLARAASDIAAMGGEPRCCLVSLALSDDSVGGWLDEFLQGFSRAARKLSCPMAGGDTTRSEKILINVSVIGEVKNGLAVARTGARPGDRVFVSGSLGEAELGLQEIKKAKKVGAERIPIFRKHLYPVARIELGKWLSEKRLASAMMDLSDGLSSDLAKLCEASGVGARIHSTRLPLANSPFTEKFNQGARLKTALHGGDDYELLFCVPAKFSAKIPRKFSGLQLTEIGEVIGKRKIELVESSGAVSTLQALGWDPFRNRR